MTTLTAPMLNFFTVESDTEVECEVCGNLFEPARNQRGRAKYCPGCRDEATRVLAKANRDKKSVMVNVTGDPWMNLAYGVIKQAKVDTEKGDRDAWQWWVSELPLWIRACGIEMRPSYLRRLRNFRIEDK